MFFALILRALHGLVDLLFAILHYLNFWKHLDYVLDGRLSAYFERQPHISNEKLPKHIGFLVAEDDISYTDLANLVVWAMTVGITCISLYDHDGEIKKNREAFLKQLSSQRRLAGLDDSLQFSTDQISNTAISKDSNKKISIKFFCHLDGKWTIANVAKSICQEIEEKKLETPNIDAQLIDNRLRSWHQVSDPEMAIIFGSVYSCFGYLPWHVRLTELFVLPTHHRLRKQEFNNVLYRFLRTEQRFGK